MSKVAIDLGAGPGFQSIPLSRSGFEVTKELQGEERFIPVRNDGDRIFIYFLEYHVEYVNVFDIVYEKENGKWIQKVSSYKKIKILQETIKQYIAE